MGLSLESPIQGGTTFAYLGGWVASLLAVLVLATVLIGTLLERRRRVSATASLLLFLGLVVLPIFMMLFGAYASVEGAKSVEFCHSCHQAMNLYVSDMRDSKSRTLAAVHASERYIPRDPCYQCHADYGVWGSVDAKLRGFSHLYHWLISSPTARGEAQIHTYQPYQNSLCLECHAGSRGFLESGRGVHVTIASNLLERDAASGAPITSCMVCHKPAHPSLAEWSRR
jgi:cytochrome c-type protein NapC